MNSRTEVRDMTDGEKCVAVVHSLLTVWIAMSDSDREAVKTSVDERAEVPIPPYIAAAAAGICILDCLADGDVSLSAITVDPKGK